VDILCRRWRWFIEHERSVRLGFFAERVQELDNVVSRYRPMFYKRAFHFLRNATGAEDAVQDALLSAYKHLGRFSGQAKLSTWLTTIVINVARMQSRRRGGHLSLDQEHGQDGLIFSEQLPDSRPSPEEVCSAVEARDRLVEGVRQLSPKLRRAFQLRDIDGLTTKEAAHVLDVPQGIVKAQLARALRIVGTVVIGSMLIASTVDLLVQRYSFWSSVWQAVAAAKYPATRMFRS
jgi:RNA polymerase sigma-70 factor, ECF subfamily